MTGASINFKPVQSASHAVQHADRTVAPSYLLSPDVSLGTICVLDDKGKVAETLAAKMAIASRQARAAKNFSPVWEGVLNLPRPGLNSKNFDVAEYKNHCIEITKSWIDEYQKATNHKVLRADIHLDEGHIDEVTGEVLLNAHAHIISDKTNERGKVFIIDRKEMRLLQTMTAEVTGLARGQSSHETGRKHINSGAYKAIVKTHGLEIQKEKARTAHIRGLFQGDTKIIDDLKAQISKIEADYKAEREVAKASGTAKQADYQRMKKERDEAIETLKLAIEKIETTEQKVEEMEKKIIDQDAELVDVKARFATMATEYQAHLDAGKPAAEFVPGTTPDPLPSQSNSTPDPGLPAFLAKHQDVLKAATGDVRHGVVKESCGSYALLSLGRGQHVIHDFGTVQAVPEIGASSDKPGPGNQR